MNKFIFTDNFLLLTKFYPLIIINESKILKNNLNVKNNTY